MSTGALSTEEALRLVVAMHRLLRGLRRAAGVATPHATQLVVLALLTEHGPLRVGELAARIPCPQPTATLTVSALRAAGLVTRETDPDDGRAARVAITAEGRQTLESVARDEARELADLISSVDDDGLAALRTAVPLLGSLADKAVRLPDRATVV